jgi:hypothetical protein
MGAPAITAGRPYLSMGGLFRSVGAPPIAVGAPHLSPASPHLAIGTLLRSMGPPPIATGALHLSMGSPLPSMGATKTWAGGSLLGMGSPPTSTRGPPPSMASQPLSVGGHPANLVRPPTEITAGPAPFARKDIACLQSSAPTRVFARKRNSTTVSTGGPAIPVFGCSGKEPAVGGSVLATGPVGPDRWHAKHAGGLSGEPARARAPRRRRRATVSSSLATDAS